MSLDYAFFSLEKSIISLIMKEFAILFTENVLKQLPEKCLDEKTFFYHPKDLKEVNQRTFCILRSIWKLIPTVLGTFGV